MSFHQKPFFVVAAVCSVLCVSAHLFAQDSSRTYSTPEAAQTDPDFSIQGEYLSSGMVSPRKGAQVIALGAGSFRIAIFQGGLPGEGWNGAAPQVVEEEGNEVVRDLLNELGLEKTERTSSTLGAVPPAGALILFDGTPESVRRNWKEGANRTKDALLIAGATTQETFRDYTLHLEFRIPFMPNARGQARGSSGVYHQGRYETQILDCFGLTGLDNEAGGISNVRKPDLNICFPPLAWQTYDVNFTAARFDAAGKKLSDARMTVRLNGVVVHRDATVPGATPAAPLKETPEPGPIFLRNLGSAVQFRNIWLLKRDADQEARRPLIPGYERFYGLEEPSQDGGLLLLGELGCVNCHTAPDSLNRILLSRRAPILSQVGSRVRPKWISEFLTDPHGIKPGTAMPDLLTRFSPEERESSVLALTHFLASTGTLMEEAPDPKLANSGRESFHQIGCTACHASREGNQASVSTSVPLSDLPSKYSIPGLVPFLTAPHDVRPSGRMPSLHLDKIQAEQIAHYLLNENSTQVPPNVHYKVYSVNRSELPNFDEMQPVKEGFCVGFDLSMADRDDHVGIRFEAFLPDRYQSAHIFGLSADGDATLRLDGHLLLETKEQSPNQLVQRTGRFDSIPVHTIQVDYFRGEEKKQLAVMMAKQGQPLEPLAPQLFPDSSLGSSQPKPGKVNLSGFAVDPELVKRGRMLFSSLGCAQCHELKEQDQTLKSTLAVRPLAQLSPTGGCLSSEISAGQSIPQYDLTSDQRKNLALALVASNSPREQTTEQAIHQTLAAFNCFACHERDGVGGPEADRNELFRSTQPEMGDEGRLPPALSGVGDKLNESWLKTVLDKGARERTYMLTRMPAFGQKNVGHLSSEFIAADLQQEAVPVQIDEPMMRVKSTGRQLVGNGGLACIKCHTFGDNKASGVQAIALTGMAARLRKDWFLRYVFDPQKYRPGTRMPTGFPNGEAVVKDVYHGDAHQQITAIWNYLSDGNKAGLPDGLVAQMIELKPVDEPILYRNFLLNVSPRAIAVGYPEKVNLAWDADLLCLKLIWHDRFLDASLHWAGRGNGSQTPLGDHLITFEQTIPVAMLASREDAWPIQNAHGQPGYKFQGYQLDEKGRPTFRYQTPFATVSDCPLPIPRNQHEGTFKRLVTLSCESPTETVYFRAATGDEIEPVEKGYRYRVDQLLTIVVQGGEEPFLRKIGNKMELLVPVQLLAGKPVTLIQEIDW